MYTELSNPLQKIHAPLFGGSHVTDTVQLHEKSVNCVKFILFPIPRVAGVPVGHAP